MTQDKVEEMNVSKIMANPNQPRRIFDEDGLEGLKETISANGQMEPLWVIDIRAPEIPDNVQPSNGEKYLLIDGERRLRALNSLGMDTAKVVVLDGSYIDAFHKGIVKQATTAEHTDVEKARGIVADLDNHLSKIDGFETFPNGSVTFLNLLHNERNKKAWDTGLTDDILDRMKAVAENVCASAGYTTSYVRTHKLPLLKLKEDLEAEVGKVVRPKGKKGGKKKWTVPASTISRLNSIEDEELRQCAVAYVKRHQLTRDRAQKLAKVVNTGDGDVLDSLFGDRISLDAADLLVSGLPAEAVEMPEVTTEEEIEEVNQKIDLLEEDDTEVAWGDPQTPEEMTPLPEVEEEIILKPQPESASDPEPVRCDRIRDDLKTFNPYAIRKMPKEEVERTVSSLREIQTMVNALLEQLGE